jgi:hypothetical protein
VNVLCPFLNIKDNLLCLLLVPKFLLSLMLYHLSHAVHHSMCCSLQHVACFLLVWNHLTLLAQRPEYVAAKNKKINKLRGLQFARELYRRSAVSANFCGYRMYRGQHSRVLGFLDRSCYSFFQIAPQLYSRGWVDPVPEPLLLRKSVSAGNQTRISGSVARNHKGGHSV